MTIGVLDTSTAVDIASNAFPNAQLKTYAEDSDLFNDLLADKIYAAVADSPRPQIVANLFPEKVDVPLSKALATFPDAFAVRRGDIDFINYLNWSLVVGSKPAPSTGGSKGAKITGLLRWTGRTGSDLQFQRPSGLHSSSGPNFSYQEWI